MIAARTVRLRTALLALALLAALLAIATTQATPGGAAANDCIEAVDEIDLSPGFASSLAVDGEVLYAIADETIVKIDTTTNTIVDSHDVGAFIGGITVAAGKLYVPTVGPDEVRVLDADTLDPVTTIAGAFAVPVGPATLGGKVYVPQQSAADVIVIDPATDTVVDSIASTTANRALPIEGMLYVMGTGTQGIDVIDPATDTVMATISVGNIPIGMATIGRTAWVTNAADDTVSQVDLDTNTTVGSPIDVAGNPRDLVVLDGALYYSSNEDAIVQAIDPATNQLGFSLQFPGGEAAELGAMKVVDDRIYVSGNQEVHVVALCGSPASTTTTTTSGGSSPTVAPAAQPARPVAGAVPRFTG